MTKIITKIWLEIRLTNSNSSTNEIVQASVNTNRQMSFSECALRRWKSSRQGILFGVVKLVNVKNEIIILYLRIICYN